MPVMLPPAAGYLWKSRRRMSASGLVTWERCPRQWFYSRRIGVAQPQNPPMLVGHVAEEAVGSLLMERLPADGGPMPVRSAWVAYSREQDGLDAPAATGEVSISDLDSLKAWFDAVLPSVVDETLRRLAQDWDTVVWRAGGTDIADVGADRMALLISGGLELQLEEVNACLQAGGGPHLSAYRESGDPFGVPAPCWDEEPVKPGEQASRSAAAGFQKKGSVSLWEAWEVARPWVKDPRVAEPQRQFHPDGWAAGELDMVQRWDGSVRIIDLKASAGTSGFSAGLPIQIRFYQWLWDVTRDTDARPADGVDAGQVSGLEGWYLAGPYRKQVELLAPDELAEEAARWKAVHEKMTQSGLHPTDVPLADPSPWVDHYPGGEPRPVTNVAAAKERTCRMCNAAAFCDAAPVAARAAGLAEVVPPEIPSADPGELSRALEPKPPCIRIRDIPRRLHVRGRLSGHWGPMANHYGEHVYGASVAFGDASVVVEEMGADSFGELPELEDAVLLDAAPGQWRRMPRLYLDEHSSVKPASEAPEGLEYTRLGLIPTKASVSGLVVSRGANSGVGVTGRPWSMQTCHIWDGDDVIEVVAFGSAVTHTFTRLEVGDRLRVLAAELGWRDGVPQLRIDQRTTRLEVERGG